MSNWWADKLGTTQPRATNLPPMPPSQQPMTMAPPAVTQQPNLHKAQFRFLRAQNVVVETTEVLKALGHVVMTAVTR